MGDSAATPLAFVHVPKSAGASFWTSVRAIVALANASSRVRIFFGDDDNPTTNPGCASGRHGATHCSAAEIDTCLLRGLATQLVHPNPARPYTISNRPFLLAEGVLPRFVVVLREPVARLRSEFYWWAVSERPYNHASSFYNCSSSPIGDWPLELCEAFAARPAAPPRSPGFANATAAAFVRWLRHPANRAHNRQTKQLTIFEGDDAVLPPKARHELACHSFNGSSDFWARHYPAAADAAGVEAALNADGALLERCLRGLRTRFAVVGIFEDLAASLRLVVHAVAKLAGRASARALLLQDEVQRQLKLASSNGVSADGLVHASNMPATPLPDELVAEVRARNRLDVALHAWGVRELERHQRAAAARDAIFED